MQVKKPVGGSQRAAGDQAEALAATFLERQGMRVLERNWRVRGGEIDLICDDRGTLAFVEVRLRRHGAFGGAAESITASKQQRLILAARYYLSGKRERSCRFDAVLLDGLTEANIEWIKNAFDAF
ncbi:MAG: YraN family protein [Sterolibacterium sp.]|nr:YraN family protein [Sterolibacterium sp.]